MQLKLEPPRRVRFARLPDNKKNFLKNTIKYLIQGKLYTWNFFKCIQSYQFYKKILRILSFTNQ